MKIDKVYCLCLDKRKDLWTKLADNCLHYTGVPMTPFIAGDGTADLEYDHVDVERINGPFTYGSPTTIKHHYNAFLCHKKMAQKCLDAYANNALFLEDDAIFLNRYSQIIPTVLDALDGVQWDMCYL